MNKFILSASAALALMALSVAPAQAQDPFYKGETITLLAGTGAGNVYDIFARMFARHLGKHIPLHPDIIVQNMPGAASMFDKEFKKLTGDVPTPLMPETMEQYIREVPRSPEIIALFHKIAGAGPLPGR